jgi:hypothetical protein
MGAHLGDALATARDRDPRILYCVPRRFIDKRGARVRHGSRRRYAFDRSIGALVVFRGIPGLAPEGLLAEVLRLAKPLSSVTGPEPPDDPPSSISGPEHGDDPEARLRWLEQQAELAYEAMYDAAPGAALAGRYSDAKEFLYDAIALAEQLGHAATAERLSKRLTHIKAVFRSQFSG